MAREKKCPQCAENVKSEAKICRFCGHEFPPEVVTNSRGSVAKGCLVVFAVFFLIVIVVAALNPHSTAPLAGNGSIDASGNGSAVAEKAAHEVQTMIAIAAGQALAQSARNPDSLIIESGRASADGKLLCIRYRAQNGFGGMNRETVAFENGKPRESAAYWNKHCVQPLEDVTSTVEIGASHAK